MKEYIIWWNAGYGKSYEEVTAKDINQAEEISYEYWKEEVESNADYGAMEATEENKEDYL